MAHYAWPVGTERTNLPFQSEKIGADESPGGWGVCCMCFGPVASEKNVNGTWEWKHVNPYCGPTRKPEET